MTTEIPIQVRRYGAAGPQVVLLHGGPAAPGYMKPIALALQDRFRILEPFQRGSGPEPLTVSRHIRDLRDVIDEHGTGRPMLVGHSWGAMLALAFAAEYPDVPKAMVLVGCGTFDTASREKMQILRAQRMDAAFRRRLNEVPVKYSNPDVQLAVLGGLYQQLDSADLIDVKNDLHPCDAKAHEQTWADMLRLQAEGVYPQAFAAIKSPVLMLHGDDDPHPGAMIRDRLKPYLPHLEYVSWPACGHYPWLEKSTHKHFYTTLTDWLVRQSK